MLVACAEEDAGPQFATDPRPTQSPTEAAASPSPALLPTTAPVATPASFTDLLEVRGAVSTVFVASGNDVWTISSAGSVVGRADIPVTPRATPVAGDADGRQTVDWSPQGDRVLAQVQYGDIVEIPPDAGGAPVPLDFGGTAGRVIAPAWSATGQSIAFISESEDEAMRSLNVLDTSSGEIRNVITPLAGRLVVDFAWLPDGVSLLFTEGGGPGNAITGIDLWRVDANGENRALVASAGAVAPVARIANVSPSPDGRSVAYAVLVPGPRGPAVDSVWVR
ncbi:MAG: hypothetical protein K0Q89_1566, partial [Thermomicrobiales bacterium]|nr:hypothetical protein [Thermomicrobiales bacterium]